MKHSIFIILILSLFYFSCQKNDPEIAGTDELSAITYSEKIYAQPINVNNQIVSIANNGTSTFLSSYDQNGSNIWSLNIDDYIIPDQTFDEISYLELQKNNQGEILLNMFHSDKQEEILKSVKFTNYGTYHSQFTDNIHQTDTIIHQADTIELQGNSEFIANGILPLSDGTTAVISSWITDRDTTFFQMSRYNTGGYHISDRYFIINEIVDVNHVYVSSSNNLILESFIGSVEKKIYIIDVLNDTTFSSLPLPIFDLYSFHERSNGELVFSASTVNNDLDNIGMIISLGPRGNYLWHQTYAINSAWIFMSITEILDGYIFTGFDIKKVLSPGIDWRSTFNTENVKAVVLKTNFQGIEIWSNILAITESSVGAITLNNENLTLFGGKYDRTVHNTIVLKLYKEGENAGKVIN